MPRTRTKTPKATVEEAQELEQLKQEAAHNFKESATRKAINVLKDLKKTLPEYGLELYHNNESWFFDVEDTAYVIDPYCKEYHPARPGRGGNSSGWYPFTDCKSLLETIKLYFWEYRGIEVIPEIELLPLLNTKHARAMQQNCKYK
jgi:hypothetical protein